MVKINIVKQHDLTDCGPACLSSIIMHYHGYVPIEVLRLKCKTNETGTSASNLISAAGEFNLAGYGAKAESIEKIDQKMLPCIAHVKLSNGLFHFVVIYEIKNNYLIVMDPAVGKVKMTKEKFSNIFMGVLIVFRPTTNILSSYERPQSMFSYLFQVLRCNYKMFRKLIIYSVLSFVLTILFGLYIKIGNNISQNTSNIILTSLIFLGAINFRNIFDYLRNKKTSIICKNIAIDLYEKFSHQIFLLPLNFIKSKSSGEIVTRYNELNEINNVIPSTIISGILDLMLALISLVFALSISFKLTCVMFLIMLIYVIVCLTLNNPTLRRIYENMNTSSNLNSSIIDNINGIISTKYTHNEENMERRVERRTVEHLFDTLKLNFFMNKCDFVKNLIYDFGKWLVLSLGLYFISIKKMSVVDLFTFEIIIGYFNEPIKNISDIILRLSYVKSSIIKLSEFYLIKEKDKGFLSFNPGTIELKNINFSYERGKDLVKNLNLKIKNKEKILIQGPSGCGKSTLCQLLSNQIKPESGEIMINGTNMCNIKEDEIRKNITYIGQKDSLLIDTIYENIKYERNVDDKEFNSACKICEIDKIAENKIYGYQTLINESSSNISGGEKQRIALARGLINSGQIIIMDEALSEVNKDMEERIMKRILNRFKDKTIIYVSHKNYDKLFDRKIVLN